jgi:hypothetical protein
LQLADPWPEILRLAALLDGHPRYLSVHPGGMVIVPGGLADIVPVQRAPKGVPIIQWEKDQAEDAGLVKMDILGNRSLAVIRDALDSLAGARGVRCPMRASIRWTIRLPRTDRPRPDGGCVLRRIAGDAAIADQNGFGEYERLVVPSSIIGRRQRVLRRVRAGVCGAERGSRCIRCWNGNWPRPSHHGLPGGVAKAGMAIAGFDAPKRRSAQGAGEKTRGPQIRDYRREFFAGAAGPRRGAETVEKIWRMIEASPATAFANRIRPRTIWFHSRAPTSKRIIRRRSSRRSSATRAATTARSPTFRKPNGCGLRVLGPGYQPQRTTMDRAGDWVRIA